MKIIFILIFAFSLQAQTIIQRVNTVRHQDIWRLMRKCGFEHRSAVIFLKAIKLQELECLESKVLESKEEVKAYYQKRADRKAAAIRLNCDTMPNQDLKDMCLQFK